MGLEYITQPQVFLAPITAAAGFQGAYQDWPLLTSFQSWVSTSNVNATTFPIPGTWPMLDNPSSFIVTVGNVIQSPTDYTVNRSTRILTFSSPVSAGVEVGVTQLATAAPSSQNFNYLQSVSSNFVNLTATNAVINNGNVNNLFVNSLTALSATINVVDITVYELSGFRATGNLLVDGTVTARALSSTTTTTSNISSRFINLEHSVPNDGINPILFIGERGDGSGGTVAGSLSGFNVTYNELGNDLIVSTQFGSVTPITAVDINSNGFVGINCNPNQALTVNGNISATGLAYSAGSTRTFLNNIIPSSLTFTPVLSVNIPSTGTYMVRIQYGCAVRSGSTGAGTTVGLQYNGNTNNYIFNTSITRTANGSPDTTLGIPAPVSSSNAFKYTATGPINPILTNNFILSGSRNASISNDVEAHIYNIDGTIDTSSTGNLILNIATTSTISITNPLSSITGYIRLLPLI